MPGPKVQRRKGLRPRAVLATALDQLRRDSAYQRRALLLTIGITVAVTTLVTVILTVMVLTSHASTADRLTAVSDVLVAATLLLAVIAALVALLAYAVSTGPPDIQLRVEFRGRGSPNNPVFEMDVQDGGVLKNLPFTEHFGRISLKNVSSYSAKNPAVIVSLHDMAFRAADPASFEREWSSMETTDAYLLINSNDGLTVVQWDGGPMYSIHGHSTRRLPDLQFSDLWYIPGLEKQPFLTFEILADGYRKVVSIPVDFKANGESRFPRKDRKVNPGWM